MLLWIAQGKSNGDIATILGCAENTVKVHTARIFEKVGLENRNAATVRALEVLSSPMKRKWRGLRAYYRTKVAFTRFDLSI